jgi:glc operon protein GlcG
VETASSEAELRQVSSYIVSRISGLDFRRDQSQNVALMTYSRPVGVEDARKAAAAALAEARANNWSMAVAVVDSAGLLVYFEKMDGTQNGSVAVAQAKARSAALFKRPTKAFQDMLAAGGEGLRVLALEGAVPIDGGLPITVDGEVVGAIGLSGGTSAQDGQCAKAGVDSLR